MMRVVGTILRRLRSLNPTLANLTGGDPLRRSRGVTMSAGHELAMQLRMAYLTVHRQTNAALAPLGLTADQFVLLTVLAECEGVTQKELVGRTGSDPNTISEMISRLEKKGLIARERHAEDGRAWSVTLTGRGRKVQSKLWDTSAGIRADLESRFTTKGLAALVEGLSRITQAIGRNQAPPPAHASRAARTARPNVGKD
jgi:DNA-binding MarR family transcriptional regulator